MFNIFKKSDKHSQNQKIGFKDKLFNSKKMLNKLSQLLSNKSLVFDELLENIEEVLLSADIGVETSEYILALLQEKSKYISLNHQDDLYQLLKEILIDIVTIPAIKTIENQLFVLLVIGVNGVGKTTTIGKLAKQFQAQGKSVMLAAGDTFRAAAAEQLKVWGERNHISVLAKKSGSDSASVAYEALENAIKQGSDVLIIDTAGRLHTQQNLMAELAKIKRSLSKQQKDTSYETMLVLDGSTGGNALSQAKTFHQTIGIDSLAITKLDGSAKGGVLFSICHELGLPVQYIGVGEGIDDLIPFKATEFVEALFE